MTMTIVRCCYAVVSLVLLVSTLTSAAREEERSSFATTSTTDQIQTSVGLSLTGGYEDGHYSSTSLNFAAAADGGFVKDDGTSINKFTPRRRRVMFDKKTTNGVVPNKAPEGEDELAGCLADGEQPGAQVGNCCNGYHLGPMGLYTSCGPDPSCGRKGTLCLPITDNNPRSCIKCCNSWSWYFTGPYCD